MSLLLIAVIAFLMTRASAGLGFRLGLVDYPDERKRHVGEVPLTGGTAIVLTLLASTLLAGIEPLSYPMLSALCAIYAVGACGDIGHIRATTRLLLHYVLGLLLAWQGDIVILNVGNLLAMGDIPLLFLAVPLTALSVAGLCNAYNMIDGIDGLAATAAALPLLTLYLLGLQADHAMASALLPALVALACFLLFNLGPRTRLLPRIFLGDSGSVSLGFIVTAALVYFSQGPAAVIAPVTALWLVTLPLMDMLATMLKRFRLGLPLMQADRSHVHHILMDMGLSSHQTLGLLAGWGTLCIALGLALEAIPAYLSLLCYFLLFCAHSLCVLKSATIATHIARMRGTHPSGKELQKNT